MPRRPSAGGTVAVLLAVCIPLASGELDDAYSGVAQLGFRARLGPAGCTLVTHLRIIAGFIDSGEQYYVQHKGGRDNCASEGAAPAAAAAAAAFHVFCRRLPRVLRVRS